MDHANNTFQCEFRYMFHAHKYQNRLTETLHWCNENHSTSNDLSMSVYSACNNE